MEKTRFLLKCFSAIFFMTLAGSGRAQDPGTVLAVFYDAYQAYSSLQDQLHPNKAAPDYAAQLIAINQRLDVMDGKLDAVYDEVKKIDTKIDDIHYVEAAHKIHDRSTLYSTYVRLYKGMPAKDEKVLKDLELDIVGVIDWGSHAYAPVIVGVELEYNIMRDANRSSADISKMLNVNIALIERWVATEVPNGLPQKISGEKKKYTDVMTWCTNEMARANQRSTGPWQPDGILCKYASINKCDKPELLSFDIIHQEVGTGNYCAGVSDSLSQWQAVFSAQQKIAKDSAATTAELQVELKTINSAIARWKRLAANPR